MHIKKKLLKNFFVQYILGFFTFLYIRTVNFTSSIQIENESIPKQFWNDDKPFILAFWHSQLMMIGFSWKKNKYSIDNDALSSWWKKINEWKYDDNHSVKMPMATIQGSQEGPIFTVTSGMHAGEYAGILAAQQLIQTINPSELSGTIKIIPIISLEAFMMRNMQLSPVDSREVHYHRPGNPSGSYTVSYTHLRAHETLR